jgi:hypothetical protein
MKDIIIIIKIITSGKNENCNTFSQGGASVHFLVPGRSVLAYNWFSCRCQALRE